MIVLSRIKILYRFGTPFLSGTEKKTLLDEFRFVLVTEG